MNIWKSIIELFKGGKHAEGTGKPLSGGSGREHRILYTIPAIGEQAVSDFRDIAMLARACAVERGRNPKYWGGIGGFGTPREPCADFVSVRVTKEERVLIDLTIKPME